MAASPAKEVRGPRVGSQALDTTAVDLPGTILVTGCGGFIGSRTAEALLNADVRVLGVDCFLAGLYPAEVKRRRVASLSRYPRFSFFELDLRTDDVTHVVDRADVVIHFAGMAGLQRASSDPALYWSHNVDATQRLLDAMAASESPAHLVHASTSSVYGARAVGDESQHLTPVSLNGETKLRAEALINDRNAKGSLSATILRYFSVYGPGQRPDMAYARVIQALLADSPMFVTGDGSQRRSNTYVDDAVLATVRAARLKPQITCNIAGNQSIALLEAIEHLELVMGRRAKLTFRPSVPGDQIETDGDASRAHEVLSWSPRTDIFAGLQHQARAAQLQGRTR